MGGRKKKRTTQCLMGFLLEDGIVVGQGMDGNGIVEKESTEGVFEETQ